MMKLGNTKINHRPKGATSLLIVVGISLVFIVIISGLTALSIRESRQALSTDLSNRALAAAESYVKETAQNIVEDSQIVADPNCDDEKSSQIFLSQESENITQITCKTVSAEGTAIEREVEKDKTSVLYGIKGDYTMKFSWAKGSACAPRGSQAIEDYEDLDQIASGYYRVCSDFPAVLELMFFSWDDASLNAINGIDTKTVLILPKQAIKDVNPSSGFDGNLIGGDNRCQTQIQADGYQCSFELNLAPYLGTNANDNVAMLVRPRYADTNYLSEFKQGNTPMPVQSNTALIDVTARVGDYYRRVTGQVKIDSIQNTNAISDTVYSLESICKRMTVGGGFNQIRSNVCN